MTTAAVRWARLQVGSPSPSSTALWIDSARAGIARLVREKQTRIQGAAAAMLSTDTALAFCKSNRGSLPATSTMDIPEHEQSQGANKQPCPMRPPQSAKAQPFEFRSGTAATWRFWIEWDSAASFFPRKSWVPTVARQDALPHRARAPLAERLKPESGYSRTRKNWNSPSRRGASCRAYSPNGDPGNIATRYSSCDRRKRGDEFCGRSSGGTSKASQPSPTAETLFRSALCCMRTSNSGR